MGEFSNINEDSNVDKMTLITGLYPRNVIEFLSNRNIDSTEELISHEVLCFNDTFSFVLDPQFHSLSDPIPAGEPVDWAYRYRLWSNFDEAGILMDSNAWFEATPEIVAHHVGEQIACQGVIIDGCCGVGGSLVNFARYCELAVGIDLDRDRVQKSRHNARACGMEDRVRVVEASIFDFSSQCVASSGYTCYDDVDDPWGFSLEDVGAVFVSPPWGGREYRKSEWFSVKADLTPDVVDVFHSACDLCPQGTVVMHYPRSVAMAEMVALACSRGYRVLEVERIVITDGSFVRGKYRVDSTRDHNATCVYFSHALQSTLMRRFVNMGCTGGMYSGGRPGVVASLTAQAHTVTSSNALLDIQIASNKAKELAKLEAGLKGAAFVELASEDELDQADCREEDEFEDGEQEEDIITELRQATEATENVNEVSKGIQSSEITTNSSFPSFSLGAAPFIPSFSLSVPPVTPSQNESLIDTFSPSPALLLSASSPSFASFSPSAAPFVPSSGFSAVPPSGNSVQDGMVESRFPSEGPRSSMFWLGEDIAAARDDAKRVFAFHFAVAVLETLHRPTIPTAATPLVPQCSFVKPESVLTQQQASKRVLGALQPSVLPSSSPALSSNEVILVEKLIPLTTHVDVPMDSCLQAAGQRTLEVVFRFTTQGLLQTPSGGQSGSVWSTASGNKEHLGLAVPLVLAALHTVIVEECTGNFDSTQSRCDRFLAILQFGSASPEVSRITQSSLVSLGGLAGLQNRVPLKWLGHSVSNQKRKLLFSPICKEVQFCSLTPDGPLKLTCSECSGTPPALRDAILSLCVEVFDLSVAGTYIMDRLQIASAKKGARLSLQRQLGQSLGLILEGSQATVVAKSLFAWLTVSNTLSKFGTPPGQVEAKRLKELKRCRRSQARADTLFRVINGEITLEAFKQFALKSDKIDPPSDPKQSILPKGDPKPSRAKKNRRPKSGGSDVQDLTASALKERKSKRKNSRV